MTLTVTLPESPSQVELSQAFLIATTWPVLSIVFSFALYRLIALERQGAANRLALLLSVVALATVTAMIAVQLAVQVGLHEYQPLVSGQTGAQQASLHKMFRTIDMGLDVAWDVLFGWSMVIGAIPMYRHTLLGAIWAIPSFLMGLLLIALNTATFPWPPASRGLFDIGPFIGAYMLLLSVRVLMVGIRRRSSASDIAAEERAPD